MKLYKKAENLNQIKGYANCNTCVNYSDKCYRYCVSETGGDMTEVYKNNWYRMWISFDTSGGK